MSSDQPTQTTENTGTTSDTPADTAEPPGDGTDHPTNESTGDYGDTGGSERLAEPEPPGQGTDHPTNEPTGDYNDTGADDRLPEPEPPGNGTEQPISDPTNENPNNDQVDRNASDTTTTGDNTHDQPQPSTHQQPADLVDADSDNENENDDSASTSTGEGNDGTSDSGDDVEVEYPHTDLKEQREQEIYWNTPEPPGITDTHPLDGTGGWVDDINGDGPDTPGRDNNCVDCARAVEARWRGKDETAAPHKNPESDGVPANLVTDWSGGSLETASTSEIEAFLEELGPGSSAIVVSKFKLGGSRHAYNAINDKGTVRWIDGQIGRIDDWPPKYDVPIDSSTAVFFNHSGQPTSID